MQAYCGVAGGDDGGDSVFAGHQGFHWVIFAAFTGLRWGELVALRARDVDLDTGVVHVVRKLAELQNGERVPGRPKSDAGLRTSLEGRGHGAYLRDFRGRSVLGRHRE